MFSRSTIHNPIPPSAHFTLKLIFIGYIVGWALAPDKQLGTYTLLLELIGPLFLAWGIANLFKNSSKLIILAIIVGAIAVVSSDLASTTSKFNPRSLAKKSVVDVALFEIYPLTGLGLGGYAHHFSENAPKIDPQLDTPTTLPRFSLYSFWSSAGAIGLIGFLLLTVIAVRRLGVWSLESWSVILIMIVGPAANYPLRVIFFTSFWLLIAICFTRTGSAKDVG